MTPARSSDSVRLFTRIYVAFVAAIVATLLASLFVSVGVRRDTLPSRWATITGGAAYAAAQTAADRFADAGPTAAQSYLAQFSHATRVDVVLYDDRAAPRAAAPGDAVEDTGLAREALATIAYQPLLRPAELRGAFPVRAAAGGARFVLVASTHGGLLPNLMLPAIRIVIALLTVGAICAVLTRSIMGRITALKLGTRRLAQGDLQYRVSVTPALAGKTDTLGYLGREFDEMAAKLEAAHAAQNRLLADVSHELRSPLTRLNFAVALARGRARSGELSELEGPLDRIEREAERMNELIGQLLTLSRWEADANETSPTRVPTDIHELLREVTADAAYEAEAAGKRCIIEEVEPVPTIPCDRELLRRAFENVVRNAVRYTADGTTVRLAVRSSPSEPDILVTVRDSGPGVPPEALNDLFRPFFRVGGARDRSSGGVGLGLAIADRAIKEHGGRIAAENANEGGLLITIALPISI